MRSPQEPAPRACHTRSQYESDERTSLPARVPRAIQACWLIESLMNFTLPSPIRTFTPPEWLLLATMNAESPMAASEQKAHPACLRIGGEDRVERWSGPASRGTRSSRTGIQLAAAPGVPRRGAGLKSGLDRCPVCRGVEDLGRGRQPGELHDTRRISCNSSCCRRPAPRQKAIVFEVPSVHVGMLYDRQNVKSPVLPVAVCDGASIVVVPMLSL